MEPLGTISTIYFTLKIPIAKLLVSKSLEGNVWKEKKE